MRAIDFVLNYMINDINVSYIRDIECIIYKDITIYFKYKRNTIKYKNLTSYRLNESNFEPLILVINRTYMSYNDYVFIDNINTSLTELLDKDGKEEKKLFNEYIQSKLRNVKIDEFLN